MHCNSTHSFEVFDALQHELIHADIKRRLVEDYGLTGINALSQAQAFNQLVKKEYGDQAGTTEHDIMIEYYLDLMTTSMLEANNNIGNIDLFRNLALYGMQMSALQYCSYDIPTVINNYNAFIIWANVPGNVSTELANCI